MKKILFFINTLDGGGAEKVLVDLVNSLDSEYYDINVVTISGGLHQKNILPHIKCRNIINVKNNLLSRILIKIFYHLPLKLAYKFVVKDKYDIEIAYLEGFPTRVISSAKSNAKKISFVHCDVSVDNIMNKFYKNNQACLEQYEKFDKVCFVSENAKKGFEQSIGTLSNSLVIHNVIDFKSVRDKANKKISYEFTTSGFKLIAVGRLSEEKGNERLVKVVAELSKKYDIELWILGDGKRKSAIENMINSMSLTNIKLMGFQKNPYAFMKKADLFICPSFYEGYSTVVAEAVTLGIPVLTTDCAGMKEILDNGKYGVIVNNSEEGLKFGLTKIFEEKNIYNNVKNAILERYNIFNIIDVVKEYDELFGELL